MTERGASQTALAAAALRAVHQLVDDEPKILDDPISSRLLDTDVLEAIRSGESASSAPESAAARSRVVVRSRYAEDRMSEAVRRGVRQCVILGAGLDTFAYRQPDWATGLRIFEVDHHATQADKLRRLQRAGVAIPSNLEFVAIDFESISLREGLEASSLGFSERAFFSCLGVLPYLAADAVDAIFELVASFPAGSEIAFTFSAPQASSSASAARAAEVGEPWRSAIEPQTLKSNLVSKGFSSISLLGFEEAKKVYFPEARRDGLAAPEGSGIGAAIVG